MSALLRLLIAPLVWLACFSAVYGLHGLGCGLGWGAREVAGMTALRLALLLGWGAAIAAQVGLLRALRPRRGAEGAGFVDRLTVMTAWLGLIATLWSLFPVAVATTCEG